MLKYIAIVSCLIVEYCARTNGQSSVGNNSDIADIMRDLTSLRNILLTSNQDIYTLQSQLSVANQNIRTLQSQLSVANQNIHSLQSQLDVANQNNHTLQSQLSVANQNIHTLQSQLAVANKDISSLKQETSQWSNLSTLSSSLASLQLTGKDNFVLYAFQVCRRSREYF